MTGIEPVELFIFDHEF